MNINSKSMRMNLRSMIFYGLILDIELGGFDGGFGGVEAKFAAVPYEERLMKCMDEVPF